MAAICADENGEVKPRSPIATYGFFRWSTVFYAGKPVTTCDDDEATGRSAKQVLARFLAEADRSYVITTDEYEPELKKAFGDWLKLIHGELRFLPDGENGGFPSRWLKPSIGCPGRQRWCRSE